MNTIPSPKRLFILVIAAALQVVAAADANVISVVNTNDNLAGSLRQAIQDAASGDTIHFQIPTSDPGYNATTGVFTITLTTGVSTTALTISKNLTIDGGGQKIVVQRQPAGPLVRVFAITAGTVELANLTIANGHPQIESGGGIRNAGVLLLRNCTLTGNTPDGSGGAVYNSGTLTVSTCTITGNIGNITGSAIYNDATLAINNSTITLNNSQLNTSSPPPGAAVFNSSSGTARIRNTIIVGNTTTGASASKDVVGAFTSEGYNLVGTTTGSSGFGVTGDQLGATAAQVNLGPLQDNGGYTKTMAPKTGSPAIDQGHSGGLTTDQRGAPRPVHRTTATNVPGDFSDIGAVEIGLSQFPNSGANLTVTNTDEHNEHDCRTDSCTLAEAIEIGSFLTANASLGPVTIRFAPGVGGVISNTTVTGGLPITASLTIIGPGARVLAISGGNVARVFAISPGAVVNLSGLTITKANSSGIGGGIFSDHGNLTLTECTVSGNTGYSGGGIFSRGSSSGSATLTITNSTISGNVASGGLGEGGALYNEGLNGGMATMTLTNCTISGNTAPNIPSTAGLESFGRSGTTNATLTNCTFSNNPINNESANLSIGNTILNAGTGGATITNLGTVTSKGHNLSSDAAGGDGTNAPGGLLNAAGDKRNTNPVLDTLKNNGGATDTLALLSNSPARDAGDNNLAPARDQRGYSRFGVSDIGAFEFNGIPPTLANVSTRLPVGIGDNALFTGFIVTGTQPKKVIIRALGPSTGVSGALANPTLELYSGSTFLEANDNWGDSPNKQAIIDTTIQPPNSLESAIVRSVPPGNYTAIERGVDNDTGIGVVDVYDLDISASSKLANVSARGLVENGDNLLFAGTIVVGQASQKVIIRALGPSTGVAGAMADPTLELHDTNGNVIESNDNWGDSPNKQAIIDSTIPPPNSRESAIVRTLTPGNYTAIVRSANDSPGIAVVEVYALN
jgi:hypothetical protein